MQKTVAKPGSQVTWRERGSDKPDYIKLIPFGDHEKLPKYKEPWTIPKGKDIVGILKLHKSQFQFRSLDTRQQLMSQVQQFHRSEVVRGKSTPCFPAGEWHCKAPLPFSSRNPSNLGRLLQISSRLLLAWVALGSRSWECLESLNCLGRRTARCSFVLLQPLWAPVSGEQLWKW